MRGKPSLFCRLHRPARSGTSTRSFGGLEETEQLPFFEEFTTYQAHLTRQDRLAELNDWGPSRWHAHRATPPAARAGKGDALKEATSTGKMTVVECMVTQELGDPFRHGALKKPVRFLEKYKEYV
jgi:hypothetical protein